MGHRWVWPVHRQPAAGSQERWTRSPSAPPARCCTRPGMRPGSASSNRSGASRVAPAGANRSRARSRLAIAARAPSPVLARGSSGALFLKWWGGTRWSGFESLGEPQEDSSDVSRGQAGRAAGERADCLRPGRHAARHLRPRASRRPAPQVVGREDVERIRIAGDAGLRALRGADPVHRQLDDLPLGPETVSTSSPAARTETFTCSRRSRSHRRPSGASAPPLLVGEPRRGRCHRAAAACPRSGTSAR